MLRQNSNLTCSAYSTRLITIPFSVKMNWQIEDRTDELLKQGSVINQEKKENLFTNPPSKHGIKSL